MECLARFGGTAGLIRTATRLCKRTSQTSSACIKPRNCLETSQNLHHLTKSLYDFTALVLESCHRCQSAFCGASALLTCQRVYVRTLPVGRVFLHDACRNL